MSHEHLLCPDFKLRGQEYEIWKLDGNICLCDPRKKEIIDTDNAFDPPLTNEELLRIYDYGRN